MSYTKAAAGLPPYMNPVPGLPTFAMVSAVSIIDPLLSYPHRLVLSIMAMHAKRNGKVTGLTQESIASLAGWYRTDKKTGIRRPNDEYVSTLINNENHEKPSDRCGPGLVQYGYVKPGHKQSGFNQPNTYDLTTPVFSDGFIHRPDGSKSQARFVAPAEREDTKVYKARKAAEQTAYELKQVATPKKKFSAVDQLPLDLGETYWWMGDEYTRKDCELDLQDLRDGFGRHVPDAVYRYFNISVPAGHDSTD